MDADSIRRGSSNELSAFAYGVATFAHVPGDMPRHELLTVELDFENFGISTFRELLPTALARIDISELEHAWLSWCFPDRLGTVIAWAIPDGTGGLLIEYGLAGDRSFSQLLEMEPERLSDIADHSAPDIDNTLCLRRFGRVFSIRERWNEIVADYLVRRRQGALCEQVAPGYFITVRRQGEIADMPAGLVSTEGALDSDAPWLARPLRPLVARELALEAYLNPAALYTEWRRVAQQFGLLFESLAPEGEIGAVALENELGHGVTLDAAAVLRRAGLEAHSLGEQALVEGLWGVKILVAQVHFMRALQLALPEGFVLRGADPMGKVRILDSEGRERTIDLWTTPLEYDLDDEDDRERFRRALGGGEEGRIDGPLQPIVARELRNRSWLAGVSRRESGPTPMVRVRGNLVEVFTCVTATEDENDLLDPGMSEIDRAHRRWRESLPASRWQASGQVVRAGGMWQHRLLVLAGPGISGIVLEAALIRGLCDAIGFPIGRKAHVYSPRSGIVVIGRGSVPQSLLRRVAYRFFIGCARDRFQSILGDSLHFRARLRLPPRGAGCGIFEIDPLDPPWRP